MISKVRVGDDRDLFEKAGYRRALGFRVVYNHPLNPKRRLFSRPLQSQTPRYIFYTHGSSIIRYRALVKLRPLCAILNHGSAYKEHDQ